MKEFFDRIHKGLPVGDIIAAEYTRMSVANAKDHYDVARNLEDFLVVAGRYREALQLLVELSERYPNDVRPLISKATLYLYFIKDFEGALCSIEVALELARRTGCFRREALGDKARILLELGRGDELSDVLEEIMSLQMIKDIPDVARERDFVDRAPPGFIREDVLARYNQFRPKRPDDTAANEPPKYEPSDD
jgi:tetratricopeptide (TPR) repeat protein